MKKYLNSKWTNLLFLILLVLTLFISNLFINKVTFTGDEPRYVYYAVSFGKETDFNLSEDGWFQYLNDSIQYHFLVQPPGVKPGHSVIMPIIISPFAKFADLYSLRWASFFAGIIGIIFLFMTLQLLKFNKWMIYLSLTIISFSIPFLPYLKLLYSDIWLCTFSIIAFFFLLFSEKLMKKEIEINIPKKFFKNNKDKIEFTITYILTPILMCFLPFLHVRLILAMGVMLLIYFWNVIKNNKDKEKKKYIMPFTVSVLMGILFIFYQYATFGSLLGSASAPNQPSFLGIPERTMIQLFDMRHGLLVFSPIYIFGIIGLVRGILKKRKAEIYSTLIIFAMMLIFIWGAASESFPARFWVATIPFFAIGLCSWFSEKKPWYIWLTTIPFFMITILNTSIFFYKPNLFIENRTFSYTYDLFFSHFKYINFSAFLPWDNFSIVPPYLDQSYAFGWALFILLVIFVFAELIVFFKIKWGKIIGMIISVFVIFFIFSYASVLPVKAQDITSKIDVSKEYVSMTINLASPTNISVIRFGPPKYYWPTPPYPSEIEVELSKDGINYNEVLKTRVRPVFAIPKNEGTKSIRLKVANTREDAGYLFSANALELYKKSPLSNLVSIF